MILTQNLCQVCAPSGNEVTQALKLLAKEPRVLWLTPQSLAEIFENLRELGQATDRVAAAEALIAAGDARLEKVRQLSGELANRPRVFCMEWLDPIYASGHWLPEMVEIAGGVDALARKGADSVRVSWDDVREWAPEVLVITPCGFNLDQVVEQSAQLSSLPGWAEIPAVRKGRVYAVDANSYFARPGPRVVEGTELLAHLFHPDRCEWNGPTQAFQLLEWLFFTNRTGSGNDPSLDLIPHPFARPIVMSWDGGACLGPSRSRCFCTLIIFALVQRVLFRPSIVRARPRSSTRYCQNGWIIAVCRRPLFQIPDAIVLRVSTITKRLKKENDL